MSDYKATNKGNLKKHVESLHEGLRYYCKQCDFSNKTHLKPEWVKGSPLEGLRRH